MSDLEPTPRTTLRRLPARGHFDRATVNAILDEALVCHVGFVRDGQPFVIPTIHARVDDEVFVHGSAASRMLKTLQGGVPVCLTATLVDGLVLARSAFHHSMNYRSVVVLGDAQAVTDERQRWDALHAIVEHVAPGRWSEVREPSAKELAATLVLRLPIEEASAKVRSGPPLDDEEDYALECWAGVLPLRLTPGTPVPDPRMPAGRALPASVTRYGRPETKIDRRG
ncbi:MAG TPA: pyridoxamine 5'-phosphate oxidase family protein [Vicinamibacteria bacterium]|nr:pyridoxamine 5'-phosphate oxidase family protein [Vicinamibacteria bacterium]